MARDKEMTFQGVLMRLWQEHGGVAIPPVNTVIRVTHAPEGGDVQVGDVLLCGRLITRLPGGVSIFVARLTGWPASTHQRHDRPLCLGVPGNPDSLIRYDILDGMPPPPAMHSLIRI